MKHGEIAWVNDYGNKGVYISLSIEHEPEGGYDEIINYHTGMISKEGIGGKRYIELHQEIESGPTIANAHLPYIYKDIWYVRGNLANRNISATDLTIEQAKNLCYKILDIACKDDTICQTEIID